MFPIYAIVFLVGVAAGLVFGVPLGALAAWVLYD
jgi:hypothetical protein